jgi:ATP-dependent DNA helicase RecG
MDDQASTSQLVHALLRSGKEHEWVEFKTNLSEGESIGRYISALANSAALSEVPEGFLIWGVSDVDHNVVGTTFDPQSVTIGNQALIPWLHTLLDPEVVIRFQALEKDNHRLVLLRVGAARTHPVRFRRVAYIRLDSHTKELARHPAYEQRLWTLLLREPVDQSVTLSNLTDGHVLHLLDTDSYFSLFGQEKPRHSEGVLERLRQHRLINRQQDGTWEIRTQAALLFARNLDDFHHLGRKAIRIVQYAGDNRIHTIRETRESRGYALSFDDVHRRIMDILPAQEFIRGSRRVTETMLPSLAIREVLANALIHQDLSLRGSGPIIEIFSTRIEVTNPGSPLVDVNRLIDAPPHSRNESLAAIMRELSFCEERGSGWDKIAFEVSSHFLPAPAIDIAEAHTRITLFSQQPLSRMSREEREWATYIHACLLYCQREHLTNARVRERFDILPKNSATASRIIADAVESGWLVPYDPEASKKMMQYVPYWAGSHP